MINPPDTVETMGWDNRELLLRIYYQVVETNGTVRTHDRELYGDPLRGDIGLKACAAVNTAYRERMKVGVRIAFTVAGVAMSLVSAILVLLIQHII
jgi:hypothetical protein